MRITLPNDQWVDLKDTVKWGEKMELKRLMPQAKNGELDYNELLDWQMKVVMASIKAWSFEVAPSRENLMDMVDGNSGEKIEEASMKLFGFGKKTQDDPKGTH